MTWDTGGFVAEAGFLRGAVEFQSETRAKKNQVLYRFIHDFYCVVVARVFVCTDNLGKRAKVREPIYAP